MVYKIFLLVLSSILYIGAARAQDNAGPNDPDNSSEQAEAREDAYRRRMELEGSRNRDTISNTTYSKQNRPEKIDKLPRESRDNIKNQLMDLIIENGQWEPFDALRAYPYEPSAAAQEDPGLRERENEAWAEQVEKYHQREASAFEANRSSLSGHDAQQADTSPRSQQGQEQGEPGPAQAGTQGEGGRQGENQGGEGESQDERSQQGSRGSSSGSASSYDPYQPLLNEDADEISTAGVSESALDFLRARQQSGSGGSGRVAGSEESTDQQEVTAQASDSTEIGAENGATTTQQSSQDSQQRSASEFIIPGTIAIEDLDKLEGLEKPEEDDSDRL